MKEIVLCHLTRHLTHHLTYVSSYTISLWPWIFQIYGGILFHRFFFSSLRVFPTELLDSVFQLLHEYAAPENVTPKADKERYTEADFGTF